jgi:hypothetical protein
LRAERCNAKRYARRDGVPYQDLEELLLKLATHERIDESLARPQMVQFLGELSQ